MRMKSDLEIAQEACPKNIVEIAKSIGIDEEYIELYGRYKCKVSQEVFERKKEGRDAKVILVTAISPTKAGEGKSTTTIGLADALKRIGKKVAVALREPSFGPVLGIKGGACGGGYAQVIPMEDINLHFTGDLHAITTANNTVSAIIDNHIFQGNELKFDLENITWKRCLDLNDRALRSVVVGLGKGNGNTREDGFNISVASEIMAILTLSNDIEDLRRRLSRTVVGFTKERQPITIGDLGCEGAILMILKDAIKPNLVQTLEGTPCFVHGGPFANIAHGCNSVIATKLAQKCADYVVTEAGFGADLGAEKFFDIKCRESGIRPSMAVIVATVRALKMHGGVAKENLNEENVKAMRAGEENLIKHIETVKAFGIPYVIAINKFPTDTQAELEALFSDMAREGHPIATSAVFERGGDGGIDLAEKVVDILDKERGNFNFCYELEDSIEIKLEKIAKRAYGADSVEFVGEAKKQLKLFKELGYDKLAVCVAKTPHSLSDNPALIGRPKNFVITVRELRPSIGAGFVVALTGDVMTMPGLPKRPSAMNMDVVSGKIVGLF